MMRETRFIAVVWLCLAGLVGPVAAGEASDAMLRRFAHCLSEKGWVMYGSITCSACRAQRKAFGDAFENITEIECNPHAPNSKVEQCLEKEISTTPTWIQEKDGSEIQRVEGYQLLEDLAAVSGCDATIP